MKSFVCRSLPLSLLFVFAAAIVQAHPGHEGGHDFTWEFRHALAHPGATLAWLIVLGSAFAVAVWFARRSAMARFQSLRGSHASRGQ